MAGEDRKLRKAAARKHKPATPRGGADDPLDSARVRALTGFTQHRWAAHLARRHILPSHPAIGSGYVASFDFGSALRAVLFARLIGMRLQPADATEIAYSHRIRTHQPEK